MVDFYMKCGSTKKFFQAIYNYVTSKFRDVKNMWPYLCLNFAPTSANLKQKNQFTFHLKMYLKFCFSVAFTKNIKQSTHLNPATLKRDFDQTSNQIKPIWGKYPLHDLYGQVPKYNLCFKTDTIDRKKLIESLLFVDTRFHILGPKYEIVSDPW